MSDVTVEVVGNSKFATAGYSRKINKEARGGHKYESEELSLFAPFDISDVADQTDLTRRIEAAFSAVKANVLNQLGVAFTINDDGVVEETLDVEAVAKSFAATTEKASTGGGTGSAPAKVRPLKDQEPCSKCGGTDFWDNRAEKASGKRGERFPDFRCAGKKADGKPCGNGRWLTPKPVELSVVPS